MDVCKDRSCLRRWLVIGSHPQAYRLMYELDRSSTRGQLILHLTPDPDGTERHDIHREDVQPVYFTSGERVRRVRDGLVGQVVETTGMTVRFKPWNGLPETACATDLEPA